MAGTGSGKRYWVFLSTVSDIGTGNKSGNIGNDHIGNLEVYKLLHLYQRKQNTILENQKLPSYIWKELIQNPEDRKIWTQNSSEGKRRIVQYISKDKSTKNQHVMKALTREIMTEIFIAEISTGIQLNNGDIVHSSDVGANELEKTSEMSPDNPARMMSSKETWNKTCKQEKKSSGTINLHKAQVEWNIKMGKTEGATTSKDKGRKMKKLLKKSIPRKILRLFVKKSLSSNNVICNITNANRST